MKMYEGGAVKSVFMKNGEFFNFELGDGLPPIIDYMYLDKEIALGNDNVLEICDEKQKTKADSIAALRNIFEELIFVATDCLCECAISHWNIPMPCDTEEAHSLIKKHFSIDPENHELLVNQLIADILYEKYLDETYMTLNKYYNKHSFYVDIQGEWKKYNELERDIHGNGIYKKGITNKGMEGKIKSYTKMMSKPEKKEELLSRGIDPNLFAEYLVKKGERKPKWIYDLIYYKEMLPAFKLHRRDAWDGSDEAYTQYAKNIIEYDKFVEKAFRPTDGCEKDYFHKSMSRYYLESLSSLEFMYKLAERLEKENVADETIIHYLSNLNSFDVSSPIIRGEADGSSYLCFLTKRKNYASAPFIGTAWLAKSDYRLDEVENNPFYSLIGAIRAQARELFDYHYKFESDDYEEISGFIKSDFNILDKLHDKQKMWHGWAGDSPLSDEQKKQIDRMRMATGVIFTKFDARKASAYIRTQEGDTEENYKNLFHTNREEFNRILSALENAHTKLHADGGRPPSMSHIEKFAVTMEYFKYNRTMDEMAAHYGISKRQMSETVYQVVRAIYDDEMTT